MNRRERRAVRSEAYKVANRAAGMRRNGPDGYVVLRQPMAQPSRIVPEGNAANVQAFIYSHNPTTGGVPRTWTFANVG